MTTEKVADEALAKSDKTKRKGGKKQKSRWSQDAVLTRKCDALCSVMERTDRIISGRMDLSVRLSECGPQAKNPMHRGIPEGTPAWTDGRSINLNRGRIEEALKTPNLDLHNFVRVFKGTNYHELGHVMFTPRNNSTFHRTLTARAARTPGYWTDYMGLEDQRMETLYTTMYEPTSRYFVAAAVRWLLDDVAKYGSVYPLIYGRRYLDPNIRAMSRKAFVELLLQAKKNGHVNIDSVEGFVRRMEQLTDQYIVCDPNTEPTAAIEIIDKYHALFEHARVQPPQGDCGTCDEGGAKANNQDAPKPEDTDEARRKVGDKEEEDKEEFEKAKERAEQGADADEDDDESEDEDGAGGESDDDEEESGDDTEGDGDGDDTDESDEGDDGEGGDEEDADDADDGDGASGGDDETGDPGEGSSGKSKGQSNGGSTPDDTSDSDSGGEGASDGKSDVPRSTEEELHEMLQEAFDEIENDSDFHADVDDTVKAFKSIVAGRESMNVERFARTEGKANSSDLNTIGKMTRTLAALKFDLEPTWLRGEPMGRINMRRAMRQKIDPSSLDIFDRWDEGAEDRASVEVVIMLDLSYSMESRMSSVSRAMWVLKATFDKCEIPATCLGFSEGVTLLFGPNEKVPRGKTPFFGTWGGTNAEACVDKAYNILARSQANNRVLITITDGQWQGDVAKCDGKIAELSRAGVTTLLFGMGAQTVQRYGKHNHDIGVDINTVEQVVDVAKRLVESVVRRARV
jgi:Mg-chelatase subunit ChlD